MQVQVLLQQHHKQRVYYRNHVQQLNAKPEQVGSEAAECSPTEHDGGAASSADRRECLNRPDDQDAVAQLAEVPDHHGMDDYDHAHHLSAQLQLMADQQHPQQPDDAQEDVLAGAVLEPN